MKKKLLITTLLGMGIAAGYSYIPSQLGKMQQRLKQNAEDAIQSLAIPEKVLYLTFDDGPHSAYTEELLELLAGYEIKATFFVVGKFAEDNSDLVLRMAQEGHTVGLHSLEHKSAMIQTPSYTRWDFKKSLEIMEDLGIDVKYYRPPWGHVNWSTLQQIKNHGLQKVLWDVMVGDWEEDSDEEQMQYRLLKHAAPGSIICLHDGRGDGAVQNDAPLRMIETLKKTIPLWLEEGYSFKTIDEKYRYEN
jgi:peptidoglycan/xylan/chitin deacetylase (PgdA/CDA1 family)